MLTKAHLVMLAGTLTSHIIRAEACTQIWRHIVREETRGKHVAEADLPFRRKVIYYYWNIISGQEWKLAPDSVDSARTWLQEKGDEHHVALLDIDEIPGTRALAFQVTDFVEALVRVMGARRNS